MVGSNEGPTVTAPPQYPMYPHPPQYHRPPHRPGLTTAAVVLVWILFGMGILNGLMTVLALTIGRDLYTELFPGLADWIPLVLLVWSAQTAVFAVLRARFASRIMRRSASARQGALITEGFSIGVQLLVQTLLLAAMLPVQGDMRFSLQFDCTGIVLSILVMCFLGAARSAWWCDR